MENRDAAKQAMRIFERKNDLPEAELREEGSAFFAVTPDGRHYGVGWINSSDDK